MLGPHNSRLLRMGHRHDLARPSFGRGSQMRPSASVHLCAVRVSLSTGEPSISAIPIKPASATDLSAASAPTADGTTSFESHVDRRLPSSMPSAFAVPLLPMQPVLLSHDCRLSYVLRGPSLFRGSSEALLGMHAASGQVACATSSFRHCPARPVTTLAVRGPCRSGTAARRRRLALRSYTWSKTSSRGQN